MEQIIEVMTSNPQYGYLVGIGVFVFIIIGLILDWDWVVEPGGGYFNIAYFINAFGRKTVRIVYGLIMLIGIIICLFGYFTYNPELYN